MEEDIIIDFNSRKYKMNMEIENNVGLKANIVGKSLSKKDYYYIRFQKTNYVRIVNVSKIKSGKFKDHYEPSVFGIGYNGVGKYGVKKHKKIRTVWEHMIERCYGDRSINTTYNGVSICKEWHNFQVYAEWYINNNVEKYQVDKDLKQIGIKDKIYSPKTCLFLPSKINNMIKGIQSNNTSEIVGVSFDKNRSKWTVRIMDFDTGKYIFIGRFQDKEDAIKSRNIAYSEQVDKAKIFMKNIGFDKKIILLMDKMKNT